MWLLERGDIECYLQSWESIIKQRQQGSMKSVCLHETTWLVDINLVELVVQFLEIYIFTLSTPNNYLYILTDGRIFQGNQYAIQWEIAYKSILYPLNE